MADNIPELKPCPFCGGATFQDDFSLHAFICDGCGAVGPEGNKGEYEGERKVEYAEAWNIRAAPKVKPLIRRPCNGGEVAECVFGDVVFSFDGEWVDEQMNQTIQVDMPWGDCEVFSNLDEADDWADEMIAARILSALQ